MGKDLSRALNALATAGSNSLADIIEEKKARRLAKYEQQIRHDDALFQQGLNKENAIFQQNLNKETASTQHEYRMSEIGAQHTNTLEQQKQLIDARIEAAQKLAASNEATEEEKQVLEVYSDLNKQLFDLSETYMTQDAEALDETERARNQQNYVSQVEAISAQQMRLLAANRGLAKRLGFGDDVFDDAPVGQPEPGPSADPGKPGKSSPAEPKPNYYVDERAGELGVKRSPGLLTRAKQAAKSAGEHVNSRVNTARLNGLKSFVKALAKNDWTMTDTDAEELSQFSAQELRDAGVPANIIEYVRPRNP